MAGPDLLVAVDDGILGLVRLLQGEPPSDAITDALREFIQLYTGKCDERLFQEGCHDAWRRGKARPVHDGPPLYCPGLTGLFLGTGLSEGERQAAEDALYLVLVRMMEYVHRKPGQYAERKRRTALTRAARDYLEEHRGIDTGKPPQVVDVPKPRNGKKKPGPKGPRCDAEKDREILEGWDTWLQNGGARDIDAYAKEKHGAATWRELREVRLAIEREQARRKRKGLKSRDKLPPRQ